VWVLRAQGLKRLIRTEKGHVGKGKSGWSQAAHGLGAKVPSYVGRHSGPGVFIDKSRDPREPKIIIANAVPFVQGSGAELNIMQRAMQNRVRNIRAKLEKIVKSGWKRK
jgi:hypothetical protein